jgi:hypothetical protein
MPSTVICFGIYSIQIVYEDVQDHFFSLVVDCTRRALA